MDLKKIFTTRKFGLTLDEFLGISIACIIATIAEDVLFPVESQWARAGIFCLGWIVGLVIYTFIKAFVITLYEKSHPQEEDAFDKIYNEFENKQK